MFEGKLVRKGSFIRKMKRCLGDTSGNVSLIFALAAIPLLLALGAGLDTARITREHSTFHAAVDTAAIAIAGDARSATDSSGNVPPANLAALQTLANEYIKANYSPERGISAGAVTVDLKITGADIKIDAKIDFPTTIMKLVNIDSIALQTSSTVVKAMRPVEVVLVMDTTGSMGGSKIANSKLAAQTFLERLYRGTATAVPRSDFIRVALVPFAAGVRLNRTHPDFNLNWIDTTGVNPLSKINFRDPTTGTNVTSAGVAWHNFMAWSKLKVSSSSSTMLSWNGCVEARKYGSDSTTAPSAFPVPPAQLIDATAGNDLHINDAAPVSTNPDTLFPAYFAPDVYTVQGGSSAGSSSAISSSSNQDGDYIGNSGTPNEQTGFATTPPSSTSTDMRNRQENVNKYNNRVVGAENTANFGPWYNCAASAVVPMTYDRAQVEAGITAMTAYGNTMLPEGLAWGLRAISPTEPLSRVQGSGSGAGTAETGIAPFNGPRWQKMMVFMTDGSNDVSGLSSSFNPYPYIGTAYSAFGFGAEPIATNRYGVVATSASAGVTSLDATTLSICNKIKRSGVTLYVVGFQVPSAVLSTLQTCASKSIAPYYQDATTANIATAFDSIASDVLNQMVYVSK
jgi:Flp pilus assembly protein TadG